MSLQMQLDDVCEMIENRLNGKVENLPRLRQQYVSFVQNEMPGRAYTHFPDEMNSWLDQLAKTYSKEVVADIHQLVLVDLMQRSLLLLEPPCSANQRGYYEKLPMIVIDSIKEWFAYIADSIATDDYESAAMSDLFRKDLAISALNMWPSRSICHYEPRALPRRFLVASGISQFVYAADMLLRKIKNRKNMYELHMEDRRMYPYFLESGWRECYLEIAHRLESEPHVSGIFAQSWFWDPAVIEASAKMGYLRKLPESGGAKFYLLKEFNDPSHVALHNKKRRRLFEEGVYTPKSYLMVWPREAILRWATAQQSIQTTLTNVHNNKRC